MDDLAQDYWQVVQMKFLPMAKAAQTMGAMAEALALDQVVGVGKAAHLLNWQPKHNRFTAEVCTYFAAWQAAQD